MAASSSSTSQPKLRDSPAPLAPMNPKKSKKGLVEVLLDKIERYYGDFMNSFKQGNNDHSKMSYPGSPQDLRSDYKAYLADYPEEADKIKYLAGVLERHVKKFEGLSQTLPSEMCSAIEKAEKAWETVNLPKAAMSISLAPFEPLNSKEIESRRQEVLKCLQEHCEKMIVPTSTDTAIKSCLNMIWQEKFEGDHEYSVAFMTLEYFALNEGVQKFKAQFARVLEGLSTPKNQNFENNLKLFNQFLCNNCGKQTSIDTGDLRQSLEECFNSANLYWSMGADSFNQWDSLMSILEEIRTSVDRDPQEVFKGKLDCLAALIPKKSAPPPEKPAPLSTFQRDP